MQSFFKIDVFTVEIDFHVFSNSNALDFGHAKMAHRVADGISLGIKNGFFGSNNDVESHATR